MAAGRSAYRLRFHQLVGCVVLAGTLLISGAPSSEARGDGCIEVSQAHHSWMIDPLTGGGGPEAFYAYRDFRSHSPLIRENASLLFFYSPSGASCGDLSLFMIHHADQSAHTRFTFSGVPDTARLRLKDDPNDAYWLAPPSLKLNWRWSPDRTDGAVLSGLHGDVYMTVTPTLDEAIDNWVLVTGTVDRPRFIQLPSLTERLRIHFSAPDPVARFSMAPPSPTVGQDVRFDAGASSAVQAEIIRYRWDFDEDGRFERVRSVPTISHHFRTASPHQVTLEVVDSAGRVGRITRSFQVRAGDFSIERRILTHLPQYQALPGTSVTVELRIRARGVVSGLGIREQPPGGWTIEPVTKAELAYREASHEWLLMETLQPGEERRIRYRLQVPEGAALADYALRGRAVSSSPEIAVPIGGDTRVEVVGVLPVEIAVSRLSAEGTIDVTLSNLISFDQILQAVALWKANEPVPGTNGQRLDLSMMARLVAYWLNDRSVTEPLS